MLNNVKIGPKLIGGFLSICAITIGMGVYGISNIKAADKADTMLYELGTAPLSNVIEMATLFQRVRVNTRDMLRAETPAKLESFVKRIAVLQDSLDIQGAQYKALLITEKGKEAFAKYENAVKQWRIDIDVMTKLGQSGKIPEAYAALDGSVRESADKVNAEMDLMTVSKLAAAKQISVDNTALAQSTVTTMWSILALAIAIALSIAISLTLSITRPLNSGVLMMSELAKGKLGMRLRLNRGDEVGQLGDAMDSFAEDLQKNVVGNLQKVSVGNMDVTIHSKDRDDEISPAMELLVKSLKSLVEDAAMLAHAGSEGKLATRADASKHQGDFRKIVQGVNDTLDSVIGPINEAADVLDKVAARDLTVRVNGIYKGDLNKIKDSINTAVNNLEDALSQVAEGTGQVSSASEQIATGAQALASGANEQASSLEEVSATLEEMSSVTKQNAQSASRAKDFAAEADTAAALGVASMAKVQSTIALIKDGSDETAEIVKTIDEIAMQTNLLALNAAVEAARAGDAGRGFAVVAEEVRNLAQRSAEAAKNTAKLIGDSLKNAELGVKVADEANLSFGKIAESSKKVTDLINEIASASKEQSVGIEQVNVAMNQLDKVTQSNAANAEEAASSAEELSAQSEQLKSMVGQFHIKGGVQNRSISRGRPVQHTARSIAASSHKTLSIGPKDVIDLDDETLQEF
jgi:methyl-accepting chemotaxis protein